jgi:hypothetical protein
VLKDVRNECGSLNSAREDDGVVINPATRIVDEEARDHL